MTKRVNYTKIAAVFLAVVTAVAFTVVFGQENAYAASGKYRLVKSVAYQVYDEDAGKWQTGNKSVYSYNKKKDPTKIRDYFYEDGKKIDSSVRKISYTYKNGKRKYRKQIDRSQGSKATMKWTFNKKGNVISFKFNSSWAKSNCKYTYTKKGWLRYETINDSVGSARKFKYNSTVKNGLPVKVTQFVKDGKKWEKMQTYKFNAKGLMTSVNYADYMGGGKSTMEYTMKNGRPTVVNIVNTDVEGNTFKSRYKITYSTKTIDKKRYSKMINDITGGGSNYFNWY